MATARKKATKTPEPEPKQPVKPGAVVHAAMTPILLRIGEALAAYVETTFASMPSTRQTIEVYDKDSTHPRPPGRLAAEIRLDTNITLDIEVSHDHGEHRSYRDGWMDKPYKGDKVSKSAFISDQHLQMGREIMAYYKVSSDVGFSMRGGKSSAAEALAQATRIAKVAQLGQELEILATELLSAREIGSAMIDALAEALEANGQDKELAKHRKNYTEKDN